METSLKPVLSNSRVTLRPLELADEELLRPLAGEKDLWTYGLDDLSVPGELSKYIAKAVRNRDSGACAVWLVLDPAGKAAGCTRLGEISMKDERGQIGWTWIGKEFRGTGINRAMKSEILRYGFETLGLNRIELKADERNTRSRRAILGIGATEEGILRQHMKLHDGYLRNTVFYSILKSEWPDVRKRFFSEFNTITT